MPHMLAQQHQGIYDCIRAGTARTHTTISAALTAIGSTPTMLVLTFAGDGIWSIGANLTIPTTITLMIPPGVTVNVAAGITLTINGAFLSYNTGWKTGTGTVAQTLITSHLSSGVTANTFLAQPGAATGIGVVVENGPASTAARVRLFTDQGGGQSGLQISTNDAAANIQGWQIIVGGGGSLAFARPGGNSMMLLSNTGLGIGLGQVPGGLLQLLSDSAYKPGAGGLWSIPSSRALKDITGDYTEGLVLLRRLPQAVRFRYNGKGGTEVDGPADVGFVAEDLQAVAPQLVREVVNPHAEEEPDLPTMLATNLGEILYVLINAVLELDRRGGGTAEEAQAAPVPPQRRRRTA